MVDGGLTTGARGGNLPPIGVAQSPDILILYDTSANQNTATGTANPPSGGGNNHLAGYRGPVKKYFSFQLVLTGEFTDGTKKWVTNKPGLLDRYLEDARFGFAGIDYKQGIELTQNGGFSYGDD